MFTNKEIKMLILSDEETFFRLLDLFYERIIREKKVLPEWISEKDAMAILLIKSKSTLQKMRDSNSFTFSSLSTKHIIYSRSSILEFINDKKQSKHSYHE